MACDHTNSGNCGNAALAIPVGSLVTSEIITISSKCYTNCPSVCITSSSYAKTSASAPNSFTVN
jgi:hypothetical protein